ncbi:hypothetical protein [Pseudomonas syringae]|uniref:hypothetical protein n=1 Tax=Pseudomonas syringae TaxID=317 RepID=UPI000E32ABFC|nr:hypothetical protein [Pseudomonas syringae]
MTPQKLFSDALERIQLDPAIASLSPVEQALKAAELLLMESPTDVFPLANNAAVAAIQFALDDDEGMQFLRLWNQGDFDVIHRQWPEAPEEVFIGADPLHKPSK